VSLLPDYYGTLEELLAEEREHSILEEVLEDVFDPLFALLT